MLSESLKRPTYSQLKACAVADKARWAPLVEPCVRQEIVADRNYDDVN